MGVSGIGRVTTYVLVPTTASIHYPHSLPRVAARRFGCAKKLESSLPSIGQFENRLTFFKCFFPDRKRTSSQC